MVKLSEAQMYWLGEIAHPQPDSVAFPPMNTLRALFKRGLIEERPNDDNPLCKMLGCVELGVTPAGLAVLSTSEQEG